MKTKTKTERCWWCGARMRQSTRPSEFTLTKKWSVTIENALRFDCPKCGESEETVFAYDKLERVVIEEVLRKPGLLAADEVAFLLKRFNMPKRELAQRLGIVPETLSRYEHGSLRLNSTVDRLLRSMVAVMVLHNGEAWMLGMPALVDRGGKPKPLSLTLRIEGGEYAVKGREGPRKAV